MRLNLRLTANTDPVPYDHLHRLTGALHKWLGAGNDLHDAPSLYSFGWLGDGQGANGHPDHPEGHLTFPRGATWRISFYEAEVAKRCIDGLMRDPEVMSGMRVYEVKEQAVPAFSGCYRFKTDRAPILARRTRADGSRQYLLHADEQADAVLTRVLRRKMKAAGLDDAHRDAEVQFDRTYRGAHTKLATIKGTKHKGSVCPVVVTGPPEAVRFAWLVGVGELTGSGFGALR